jgi:hyperosmotically inducible protein
MKTSMLALLTILGFVTAATSAAQSQRTIGNVVDDSTVAAQVKTALVGADNVPGGSINVEVHQGNVQLAAFVDSQDQIQAALEVARSISGVKSVRNSLVVAENGRSFGQTLDDQVISGKLKTALVEAAGLGEGFAINSEVRRGQVLLSGFVPSSEAKDRAETVARGISGVTEIYNRIDVM